MGAEPAARVVLDGRDLGLLYESLLAGADDQSRLSLALFSPHPGAASDEPITGVIGEVRVEISHGNPSIVFWRTLGRAVVNVNCSVQLGVGGADFRIGPFVDLECESLICSADTLRILATPGGKGNEEQNAEVVLLARAYSGTPPKITIIAQSQHQGLSVDWPNLTYPWVQYKLQEARAVADDPAIADAYNHLSRFLKWFQSQGYGDLARHHELVEKFAVGGTEQGRRLLDYCISRRLIVKEGPLYKLDSAVAQEIGIHWVDLRDRRLGPAVITFLKEFVDKQ